MCHCVFDHKGMQEDKVEGLLADRDYITKPFSSEEFLLRIEAILRRTGNREPATPDVFTIGEFSPTAKTTASSGVARGKATKRKPRFQAAL